MHCNKCCANHKNDVLAGSSGVVTTSGNIINFVTTASSDYVNISTTYNGSTFTNYINGVAVSSSNDCACECHDLCDCDGSCL